MILRGLALLARGRAAGMAEFSNSADGLLASLAPLIAFPLVGAAITALNGQWRLAAVAFLARLSAVLVLPVIMFEFARLTKREALWMRTTAALNWSFWLVVPLLLVAAIIGAAMVTAGLPMQSGEYAAIAVMGVYLLWFHWFTVRAGMQLGVLQALALVALNDAAITICTMGPGLLGKLPLHL